VDHPHGEAYALNRVAETLLSIRQPDQARAYHAAALTLASQIGARYEQARAHNGLALTHQADGDLDQARHHWRKALAAYTNLGVPDVEDVRTYLTALDQAAENESR
jgi:tetratricopeptide (TPR) repeat protein